MTFLIFFYADWISFNIFHSPELTSVLRIFTIGVPFWVLSGIFNSGAVGFQEIKYQVYTTLITGWTDTLMLGYFCTPPEVGIYNVAAPTAKLMGIVLSAFGIIFMPVVTELYARNREGDLRNAYSSVTKWIFAIVLPGFLLMALFSTSIIKIMFGAEYVDGAMLYLHP